MQLGSSIAAAVAVAADAALITPLAWKPPYVTGKAVKRKKKIVVRVGISTFYTRANGLRNVE